VPDDQDTPRPRRAPTATERVLAEAKARRADPRGIPVHVDFEDTPPPADTRELDRHIPDDVEWARALAAASKANAEAIAHEQRARREAEHAGREWGALTEKVGTLAAAVNRLAGLEHLPTAHEKVATQLEQLVRAEDVRRQRDDDHARQMERLFADLGGAATRIGQLEQATALADQRVDALAANLGDRIGKVEDRVVAVEHKANALDTHRKIAVALTRREQAKAGGWGAVAGAVASAAAWLLQHFLGG
jgi:hypothetical protein